MTPRVKGLMWRYGSVALFCGMPLLLLLLIGINLRQAALARDLTAQRQAMLSQIVAKLATHHGHVMTADETASLYLANATSSLARAELQEHVTKLVESVGGRFAEARPSGTPEQEAAGILAIQVSLAIDNKGLLDLLYQLETGLPLLTVTDLSVMTNNGQNGDRAGEPFAPLTIEITVQGHFRKSA